MDALVVFGFLLIPVLGGITAAAPVFSIAYILNVLLIRFEFISVWIHISAITYMAYYFYVARQDELGREVEFQIAFIIGVSVCFLIYLAILYSTKTIFRKLMTWYISRKFHALK
jgi:hypothetical protein